ncbi:hypothetical protein ABLB69_15875 [Xenorhabdus khoisanae]|nr:hypothetical protein [Xenorhabdus khoisanae]
MSDVSFNLEYYPLDLATKTINRSEMELLLLAQAGEIEFRLYPDPTGGILEWDSVTSWEIGVIISRNRKITKKDSP